MASSSPSPSSPFSPPPSPSELPLFIKVSEIKQLKKTPSALNDLKGPKLEGKQKQHNLEPWEGKVGYRGLQILACAVWPWETCLTSLDLSFLCKMDVGFNSTSQNCCVCEKLWARLLAW